MEDAVTDHRDEVPIAVSAVLGALVGALTEAERGHLTPRAIKAAARARYETSELPAVDAALEDLGRARRANLAYGNPNRIVPILTVAAVVTVASALIGLLATVGLLGATAFGAGTLRWAAGAAGTGATVAVIAMALILVRRSIAARWRRRLRVVDAPQELDRARDRLRDAVRTELLQPALQQGLRIDLSDLGQQVVTITTTPQLSSRTKARHRVVTTSHERVLANIGRDGGATVGIAGERGAGKSELLRAFCDRAEMTQLLDPARTVGIVVPAPVAYRPEEFLRLIALRLCEATPGVTRHTDLARQREAMARTILAPLVGLALLVAGIAIATVDPATGIGRGHVGIALGAAGTVVMLMALLPHALAVLASIPTRSRSTSQAELNAALRAGPSEYLRVVAESFRRAGQEKMAAAFASDLARRLRYVETRKLAGGGEAAIGVVKLNAAVEQGWSALPLSEPEIVAEIAVLGRHLTQAGYQVIVGLDELDKLESDTDASKFLNGMKALFPIRDCSFLVSISESAWISFTGRGIPLRDVFDSSLDSVVVVEPLELNESRVLLTKRIEALTDAQVLTCHWLSGGLPRELLRFARRLGEVNAQLGEEQQPFPAVLVRLLLDEVHEQARRVRLEARSLPEGPDRRNVIDVAATVLVADWDDVRSIVPTIDAGPSDTRPDEGWPGDRLRLQLSAYVELAVSVFDLLTGPLPGRCAGLPLTEVERLVAPIAQARRQMEVDLEVARADLWAARRFLGLPGTASGPTLATAGAP